MWFSFRSFWLTSCALFSIVRLCFKASQLSRLTPVVCLVVPSATLLISFVMETARWPRPALAGGCGDFTQIASRMIDYLFVEKFSQHQRY